MELDVVVPADDQPSGGNVYDARVCAGLRELGWTVREHAVAGGWPRPDVSARAALARVLAEVPDGGVVLVDGLVACGVPDVIGPAARRVRLAVLVHLPLGDDLGQADLAAAEKETLHAAQAVIATSPWVARRLGAHLAAPGVDPAPLTAADGASRLLSVGSVTPTKGHDLLVAALAEVAELPWTCEIVGPLRRAPAHVERLRAAIVAHRIADRVWLSGELTGGPLAAAYASSDLLVLPSRVEAYGMVVTEALARGIPVLAADVGGVRETVGAGGLVVRHDELAAALRRWLTEPELRSGLRAAARAERSTVAGWEVTVRCLAEVLSGMRG